MRVIAIASVAIFSLLQYGCDDTTPSSDEIAESYALSDTLNSKDRVIHITDFGHSEGLSNWVGNYNYEEEPVESNAGYSMFMKWTLSIAPQKEKYKGILEINGQQTGITLLTNISGDSNFVYIIYDKLLSGVDERLNKGDTLFTLLRNNDNIKTDWGKLRPRLNDNPLNSCFCFE